MPILGAPALVGAGGGTATATTLGGGITATQATGVIVVLGLLSVGVLVDDYLDRPVTESEQDRIKAQAGERSKADRRRLQDCKDCIWCQINIQAQGNFLPLRDRSDAQGIGPYLVRGRTVYAREGVIVAGMTHMFAKKLASRRDFRQIESWDILGRTVAYILARPPAGLPPGEHRAEGLRQYSRQVRYDINVAGTINAFMA